MIRDYLRGEAGRGASPEPEARDLGEALLAALLDGVNDGLYVKDRSSRFLWVNDLYARALGVRDPSEAVGRSDFSFLDYGCAEDAFVREQSLMHSGTLERERAESVECRGGGLHRFLVTRIPLRGADGEVIGLVGVVRDAEPLQRWEAAYVEAESRRASVLDALAADVLVLDGDLRISWVNRHALERMGLSLAEARGLECCAAWGFGPERRPECPALQAMERRDAVHARIRHGERTHDVVVKPILDRQGGAIGAVEVRFDVTDRLRAERDLAASRKMLQLILDTIPVGVYWKDLDGVYLGCNRTAATDAGLDDADAIGGKTDRDLAWRDLAVGNRAEESRVIDSFTSSIGRDESHVAPDGTERWFRTSRIPLRNEEDAVIGLLGCYMDVTEERLAQARLEEARQDWEEIFQAVGQAALILDPERRILAANRAAADSVGATPEEMVGKQCFTYCHGPDGPPPGCPFTLAVESGALGAAEKEIDGGDGAYLIACTPVYDSEGALKKVIHIATDISDRREAERQHRKLEDQLRRTQRLESLGVLAGGIAHDFNNILGAVFGYTELALQAAETDETARSCLEQIMRAARRAKDLVDQIRAFSRPAESRKSLVEVGEVVEEALKLLRPSLPSTIAIRLDLAPEGARVLGDATQLHQVVMNLCTNAQHAMSMSGGVLHVGVRSVEVGEDLSVQLGAIVPGQYVRLTVSDTGAGIAPDVLDSIFDPFYTTKPKDQGTGLGLSTTHGIVSAHDGAISVYSELGRGTTFHVYIPRVDSEPGLAAPDSGLAVGSGHVLVVDDEPVLAAMAVRMLRALGYEATSCEDAVAALALFTADPGRFALVLTDQTMPQLTGAELARCIHDTSPDTPVVLMSGGLWQITAEPERAGVAGLLPKPFTLRQLAEAMAEALGRDRAPRPVTGGAEGEDV